MSAAAWSETLAPTCAPGRPRLRLVPTAAAVPPAPSRRLRLTRRGRLSMTIAMAVLVAVAAFSTWSSLATAAPAGSVESVTVVSGETLSQIAAREMPDLPTDRAVVRLVEANGLATDQVLAGQRLVIPAR